MSLKNLELVAIVWPIVDDSTGIIQRFAARAYAMQCNAMTMHVSPACSRHSLQAIIILQKKYPIPQHFEIVTEHGTLDGAVSIPGFNEQFSVFVDPALKDLELECQKIDGISSISEEPKEISLSLQFAKDTYLVVTFLLEDLDGTLHTCHLVPRI